MKFYLEGVTCASLTSPCGSNPCQNGGTCTPSGTTFTCSCPSTHTGDRCQTQNDGNDLYIMLLQN